MVDAQTISLVFGGLSVGVAAIYYIYNMRTTLQTRQAQFFIQFYQNGFSNVEGLKRWIEILHYEFKDYDEFEEKYGSENNPQACAERMQSWNFFDALGLYMKQGLVDRRFVYEYVSTYAIWM